MTSNRIRIQPKSIDVPKDDPFRHDLLGRKEFADTLAATLGAIAGPGVFAIDGGWGTGKTTFLAMFSRLLENEDFRVVNINAWETDYADSPLAALVSKVAEVEPEPSRRAKFKKVGARALKAAFPAAVKIATYGLVEIGAASEKVIGDVLAKFAESGLARFEEDAQCMTKFKEGLRDLAAQDGEKPLVVVVDELDRCRPTHAVEMLETIKHAFDVDNLLFVLALSRHQLDESAKVLYGDSVSLESYFKRFFDVELVLPEADPEGLVRTMLEARRLPAQGHQADLLAPAIAATGHKIRTIERTLDQYALCLAMLDRGRRKSWWILPTVFILRLVDEEGYRGFVGNQISDEGLADRVFHAGQMKTLRTTSTGHRIEAALMLACEECAIVDAEARPSSLLAKYRAVRSEQDGSEASNHAAAVMHEYTSMTDEATLNGWHFWDIVERVARFEVVAGQLRSTG